MKLCELRRGLPPSPLAQPPGLAQGPQPAPAAGSATVQQQNEEILKELRAIRILMESVITPQRPTQPAQPTVGRVTNLKGYSLGRADAPLTMVEFTDLQCPFCRQFALSSFDEIKKTGSTPGSCATSAATSRSTSTRRRCRLRAPPAAPASRASSGGAAGAGAERQPADHGLHQQDRRGLKLDMKAFAACSTTSSTTARFVRSWRRAPGSASPARRHS